MIEFLGQTKRLTIDELELEITKLQSFRSDDHVWLQTCNRVELYRGDGSPKRSTVEHLFRVVSGLESSIIGESHIQGQVKRAYGEAIVENHISSGLHRLFQSALRCGKRVRTETAISEGAMSHSHAAVFALKRHLSPATNSSILIIGVNELTERIVKFLGHGDQHFHITIANRTAEKARILADQTGAGQIAFGSLKNELSHYDAIISATSSPDILIDLDDFDEDSFPVLIDLAVPRDMDPRLAERTTMYNLTDCERIISESTIRRTSEIETAEHIIMQEIDEFMVGCKQGDL